MIKLNSSSLSSRISKPQASSRTIFFITLILLLGVGFFAFGLWFNAVYTAQKDSDGLENIPVYAEEPKFLLPAQLGESEFFVDLFQNPTLANSMWSASITGSVLEKKNNSFVILPVITLLKPEGVRSREVIEDGEKLEIYLNEYTQFFRNPETFPTHEEEEAGLQEDNSLAFSELKEGDILWGSVVFEKTTDGHRVVGRTITVQ